MVRTSFVGCCGFPVAQPKYWKEFSAIEINSTFYQLPRVETAGRWSELAPRGAIFAMKAWQLITHLSSSLTYKRLREKMTEAAKANCGGFRNSAEVKWAWKRTREIAEAMSAGIILFQCPSSFGPTADNVQNLTRFFKDTPRGKFIFAWEPRGSWPVSLIESLCRGLELIHVVDPMYDKPVYGVLNYFRLHGLRRGSRIVYNHTYTDSDIKRIGDMCTKPQNYVFFNNSTMWNDAIKFKKTYA